MEFEPHHDPVATPFAALASRLLGKTETVAYMVLGLLLALAALLGVGDAAVTLWHAASGHDDAELLVGAIGRLLFVLMIVEILHTVRVSFRSGEIICEPFLIVGLIASIRRMLVITLESSQAYQPGHWTPEAQVLLNSTMLELVVLGFLILIFVVSIYVLRRSKHT